MSFDNPKFRHTSGVEDSPGGDGGIGKGWVDIRATTARLRSEYVQIVAEVQVNTEDPIWKNYGGENFHEIQKAIMARLKTAVIIRGAVQRRDRFLLHIARGWVPGKDGWLDFWTSVLGVNVVEVISWDVFTPRKRKRS